MTLQRGTMQTAPLLTAKRFRRLSPRFLVQTHTTNPRQEGSSSVQQHCPLEFAKATATLWTQPHRTLILAPHARRRRQTSLLMMVLHHATTAIARYATTAASRIATTIATATAIALRPPPPLPPPPRHRAFHCCYRQPPVSPVARLKVTDRRVAAHGGRRTARR